MRSVLRPASRRSITVAWLLLAAVPVAYVATLIFATSRNIVFWDEFDSALAFILRLNAGADWHEIIQRLFSLTNEHRTVTSRLIFAISYWVTGSINFHVIGAIGNLCFVGACAACVFSVQGWERRLRMTVVLALVVVQLEHFEAFIWSGASIDHFQVVMLAALAIAALSRGTRGTIPVGIVFATLATFTLAHGIVVWPVGALQLGRARRWRAFAAWVGAGLLVCAAFLHGFEFNPGDNIPAASLANTAHIAHYWLTLLGAPLTLGRAAFAPLLGVVLLALLGFLARRGFMDRQPMVWYAALYAIGALGLIALGRIGLATGDVNSRYLVLGALAWALVIFLLLELAVEAAPAHPFRPLVWILPMLAAFNLAADGRFAPQIDAFTEVRDRAATSFEQYGRDGMGVTRLHPRDGHAYVILKNAEDRGIYRLPEFSHAVSLAEATPSTRMITYVDELVANERAVTVGGWAMLPGETSRRGDVFVILHSVHSHLVFSTVPLQRSDVAAAYKEPRWNFSGFRAVIRRERLPRENFEVGILIAHHGRREFVMTGHHLDLVEATPKAVRAEKP